MTGSFGLPFDTTNTKPTQNKHILILTKHKSRKKVERKGVEKFPLHTFIITTTIIFVIYPLKKLLNYFFSFPIIFHIPFLFPSLVQSFHIHLSSTRKREKENQKTKKKDITIV